MKIGILLCGHPVDEIRDTYGDFHAMFERLFNGMGLELVRYDVEGMEFPNSVDECGGWLISGSKHGAYENHPFIPPLEKFVRDAHEVKIPMVGICFGHQIIAQAFGGTVEKFEGGWSVGRVAYETDDGDELALNAWHQDQVITPPPGAKTVARSDFCKHAALVYPDGILTIQPHPEFDNDLTDVYLRVRGRAAGVPQDLLDDALNPPKQPIQNELTATKIAKHFKKYARTENV